jgi:fructose-1,6-bisphosphatase/inositol monophosphatase family enzyme
MLDFNLRQVLALAREAGRIALRYFGEAEPLRKADKSFVTRADHEIEEMVRHRLGHLTPGYGVLGEEGGLSGGAGNGAPCWVVDPLDGTSAFISGLPTWAFSLGLLRGDEPLFGLVYLPLVREMYYTGQDGRVLRNGLPFDPEPWVEPDGESVLYVPSDVHRRYRVGFPGKVRSLGSAAYHGLLTARSHTAGVLQGRVYLWDLAAVLALNKAWGMRVADLSGRPVTPSRWGKDYSLGEPILLCRPQNFEMLVSGIEAL